MFRKTHDLWAGDPAFVDLLDRLRARQSGVRRLVEGARHPRRRRRPASRWSHPKKGVLRFQHASFQCNDEPGLKLVIYTPV